MPAILSRAALLACVQEACGRQLPDSVADRIGLYPARATNRGDLSTDAALHAARFAGMPAGSLAEILAARFAGLSSVREAHAAEPGFVNLSYSDDALDLVLPAILALPEAGPDAGSPRPIMLSQMHRADPDFMVQYAYARCCSVLRAAAEMPGLGPFDAGIPGSAGKGWFIAGPSRDLVCRLDHWMRLAEASDLPYGYGHIRLFLREFGSCFERLWQASSDHVILRLLHPTDPARSRANLALVLATANVIRLGLGMLGVEAAEELR